MPNTLLALLASLRIWASIVQLSSIDEQVVLMLQ